jgi:serine/threonine protein phosphatase PrpC
MGLSSLKRTIAVHWQFGASTHTGWFRTLNEDRSLLRMGTAADGAPFAVAALADGMGGTGDGGLASELAITELKLWLEEKLPELLTRTNRIDAVENGAAALFRSIQGRLIERSRELRERLGTTLTLLLLVDSVYTIIHIGDCRIYRYLPATSRIKPLTRDHTWVSEQVQRGLVSKKKARIHPKRHVLLQFLGMRDEPKLYIQSGYYSPKTWFLLSSDGFHDRFSDEAIALLLKRSSQKDEESQEICDALLSKAMDRRPDDNISLLLLKPLGRMKPLNERFLLHLWLLWRRRKRRVSDYAAGRRK